VAKYGALKTGKGQCYTIEDGSPAFFKGSNIGNIQYIPEKYGF